MNHFILILLFLFSLNAMAKGVGFSQFELNDEVSRPLNVTLWYPTRDTTPTALVADNIAFEGTHVVKEASVTQAKHPLVLLSHGYRGSWRNLNWLAHKLAQQGYIVAAPDHPGTTTFDHTSSQTSQWWQRPNDLVRVLNYLENDAAWQPVIVFDDVTAIGHSLGGWSVAQLVGAQFDRSAFMTQCKIHPNPRTCGLAKELGLHSVQDEEPESSNFSDPRVKRVIILDLGLARSFSTSSLNKIQQPSLILAAGIDIGDLPQAMESGYLAEHIPLENRRYKVFESATHFSYMQLCKANAIAVLEEEFPGDGVICKDGIGSDRRVLHNQIFDDVKTFLVQ
ncbi:alpha/beta hydrolase [Enterovibrio makurazakiensis]|uniref:alpha/beta hydrolase family protein n=1 Tax=Enterovibrio makurazakiensis TaxID=2910232 RepID=UPI003D223F5F